MKQQKKKKPSWLSEEEFIPSSQFVHATMETEYQGDKEYFGLATAREDQDIF